MGREPQASAVESVQVGLRRALVALCVTEITSWGVLYYAFPVVLTRLTRATGWPTGRPSGRSPRAWSCPPWPASWSGACWTGTVRGP